MVFYSTALLFIAAASRHTSATLATAIVNGISAIIPIILAVALLNKKEVIGHRFGVVMALCGGVAIAFFGLSLTKALTQNKVGIVSPVVFGGAIFASTIASFFIFKEKTTPVQSLGLMLVGLGLIAIIYARATAK